jgi:fatty acid desaturase
VLDYRLLLYGYVVPFLFVLPVLNTVRIVLEHFDLDTGNPFWVGTFYRTGPVTRIMFWWIGGDCHVVHHFYATIPWYRLPRAIRLIRPILLRNGVYEHRSLGRLLLDWFAGDRAHWSVPAAARALSESGRSAGAVPPR